MAARLYVVLCVICIQFGPSVQHLNQLQRRLKHVEKTLGRVKVRIQLDISELWEAVSLLQNRSEENTPIIDVSPLYAVLLAHLESKVKGEDLNITALSKAISDEKTLTRDQMDDLKSGLKSNLNETQQLKKLVKELKIRLLQNKHINDKLTEELHELRAETKESKYMYNQTEQIQANTQKIIRLEALIMEMHQKTNLKPSTTIVTNVTMATQQTSTTVPVILTPCPDGWEKFQNSCYLLVKERATWEEAKARCAIVTWCVGGAAILAEPDTEEEHQFLAQMTGALWYTWLGGSDRHSAGTWAWNGTGRPIVYTRWAQDEPSSEKHSAHSEKHSAHSEKPCVRSRWPPQGQHSCAEDCLAMDSRGWYDYWCTSRIQYICEQRANV